MAHLIYTGSEPVILHERYGGGVAEPGAVVTVPDDVVDEALRGGYLARQDEGGTVVPRGRALVDALRRAGLPTGGTAADKRERLLTHLADEQPAPAPESTTDPEPVEQLDAADEQDSEVQS